MKNLQISWPVAAVVVAAITAACCVAIFGPVEFRAPIIALLMAFVHFLRFFASTREPERIEGWTPPGPKSAEAARRTEREGWASPETMLTLAAGFGVVCFVAWLVSGCGASAAVRSAYALEVARCIANERGIVEQQGTTEAEDRAAMALERARCDAALRQIEEEPAQ